MPPLLIPFAAQIVLAAIAFAGAPWIARRKKAVWATVCLVALGVMLLWPLMRFYPVQSVRLLGPKVDSCIELTGLAIPAVLLFAVASRHLPKKPDQRAVLMLTAVAAIYFVKAGWWMIAPAVELTKPTKIGDHNICMQTTGYTCVAASMVTMLRARGIAAEEAEMARLAYTQVNGGATDSRALWALEKKLAGTGLRPRYQSLDRRGVIDAPKPCMVQLDWGFFVSHMVPVMAATETEVTIGDPINGQRMLAMEDFLKEWKGNAITLVPVEPGDGR